MRSAFNSSSASACCISPLNNNIWRYTLGGAELTFLTNYDDENRGDAFGPSVSPDGAEIVFNYAPTGDAAAELQIMDSDGGNVRSLGGNGLHPDWGIPGQISQPTLTPTPTGTSQPTPTPTATGAPQPTLTPTPVPTLEPAEVTDAIYLPVVQR